MRRTLSLLSIALLSTLPLSATDWPQYRGPKRDDVSAETGLLALSEAEVDLNFILQKTVRIFREKNSGGVDVQMDVPAGLPRPVGERDLPGGVGREQGRQVPGVGGRHFGAGRDAGGGHAV